MQILRFKHFQFFELQFLYYGIALCRQKINLILRVE